MVSLEGLSFLKGHEGGGDLGERKSEGQLGGAEEGEAVVKMYKRRINLKERERKEGWKERKDCYVLCSQRVQPMAIQHCGPLERQNIMVGEG